MKGTNWGVMRRLFFGVLIGILVMLSSAAWAEMIVETVDGRTFRVPVARHEVSAIRFTEPSGQPSQPLSGGQERLYLDKSYFRPGEAIRVHFSAPSNYDRSAWIGIVPANIGHGSEVRNDQHDLTYQYLEKKTKGTFTFKAPTKPGRYDFRMHNTDNKGRETAYVTFVVQ